MQIHLLFQWTNMIKCSIWCIYIGQNVRKCPQHCLSRDKTQYRSRCPSSELNMIKCPLPCRSIRQTIIKFPVCCTSMQETKYDKVPSILHFQYIVKWPSIPLLLKHPLSTTAFCVGGFTYCTKSLIKMGQPPNTRHE